MADRTIILCLFVTYLGASADAWACGGGWAPFVPAQTSSASASQKGVLNTFDKGISYDLFNDKELQPLIRDIVSQGNTRKRRGRTEAEEPSEDTEPVLNIQRLH